MQSYICFKGLCIKTGIQERGTECRERGEWGKCYILGNVAKHSWDCPQTIQGMSWNIPENVLEYSWECCQTFLRMLPNIPGNVAKHSKECPQTFQGMFQNIPGNVAKNSGECRKTFWRMSPNITGNVVKHSRECRQTFRRTFFKHSSCSEQPNSTLLAYISIVFQKWNYLNFIFINESKVS